MVVKSGEYLRLFRHVLVFLLCGVVLVFSLSSPYLLLVFSLSVVSD